MPENVYFKCTKCGEVDSVVVEDTENKNWEDQRFKICSKCLELMVRQ